MSHDPHPHRVADDPDVVRLRARARMHDGVVPVPFLGTTWRHRGRAYWRRRVGAVILLVALTVFVGAIATAFTAGIIAGIGHRPAGAIVGTLYALVAIPASSTAGGASRRRPSTTVAGLRVRQCRSAAWH